MENINVVQCCKLTKVFFRLDVYDKGRSNDLKFLHTCHYLRKENLYQKITIEDIKRDANEKQDQISQNKIYFEDFEINIITELYNIGRIKVSSLLESQMTLYKLKYLLNEFNQYSFHKKNHINAKSLLHSHAFQISFSITQLKTFPEILNSWRGKSKIIFLYRMCFVSIALLMSYQKLF